MKTQLNNLTRMLGGFAAAFVLLVFAGTASAQTVIDFNSSDQAPINATEAGFTGVARSSDKNSVSQPVEIVLNASFGNGNFTADGGSIVGVNGEYLATVRELAGGITGIESRSRTDNAFQTPDLVRDYFKADQSGSNPIFLEFDGLEAGQYNITTWHTGVTFYDGSTTEIFVTDVNRSGVSIGSTTQNGQFGGGGSGPTNIASLNFDFEANGNDTVSLRINTAGNPSLINGYELTQIPEPGSFALTGGVLALGAVMLRRRRG